jgi:hypothetical protein
MSGEEQGGSDGVAGGPDPLPFDFSKAHQARMYDFLLAP